MAELRALFLFGNHIFERRVFSQQLVGGRIQRSRTHQFSYGVDHGSPRLVYFLDGPAGLDPVAVPTMPCHHSGWVDAKGCILKVLGRPAYLAQFGWPVR